LIDDPLGRMGVFNHRAGKPFEVPSSLPVAGENELRIQQLNLLDLQLLRDQLFPVGDYNRFRKMNEGGVRGIPQLEIVNTNSPLEVNPSPSDLQIPVGNNFLAGFLNFLAENFVAARPQRIGVPTPAGSKSKQDDRQPGNNLANALHP